MNTTEKLTKYAKSNQFDWILVKRKITSILIHNVLSYMNKHGGLYVSVNNIIRFLKVYHKHLWSI